MRKPTPNKQLENSMSFISGAEDSLEPKRGRPKSGTKTKPVTISCTKDDLEAMDDVIELSLNIKNDEGKRIKITQSESVRLGFEAVKLLFKDNPNKFKELLQFVKLKR